MEFKNYLQKSAKEIEKEIQGILAVWAKKVAKIDPKLKPLIGAFIQSCKGGKRIRGALVKLGYEIAQTVILSSSSVILSPKGEGSQDLKTGSRDSSLVARNDKIEIVKVAAAYEILHTSILAHDDIIDQDIERRGKPSLYQALGGNHYGISQAISLADAGFFLATRIIAESQFQDNLKNQSLKLFSQTMVDTAIGQMLDIAHADPKLVAKLKTARYTIAGPLKLGATLAGVNGDFLRELGEFGERLGIAFQIKDDMLDGDLPALTAVRQAGRQGIKSKKEAEKDAREYINRALEILPKITKDQYLSKILEQMADYLIQRTK